MNEKFIINIGRELGSGGKAIGERLAKIYNIHVYDKKLITLAAEESGICQKFFEKADESNKGFISSLMGGLRIPFISDGAAYDNYLSNDALFKIQSDVIRKLANRGPCVIVGRCSDYVLRDRTDVLNAFVYAPESERLKHIMDVLDVSEEAARVLIDKNDKQLHARYKQMTGTYRGDRHNRHLLIDSSVLGFEKTAKFIEDFAKQKFGG